MTLEEALKQLITQRKARRLRLLWPVIEAKLAEGVTHAEVLGLLNANGLDLTERTYKSYLYRLRKRRRETGKPSEQQRCEPPTPHPVAAAEDVSARPVSLEPATAARPRTFDFNPRGLSPKLLK